MGPRSPKDGIALTHSSTAQTSNARTASGAEVLGSTDDKPTVTLETPSDPDRVSSFLNIRWRISGRDGHLIEVGQAQR